MVLPVNQYIKPRDKLINYDNMGGKRGSDCLYASGRASSGGQLYVAKKAKRNGMEMKIYDHEEDQEVFSTGLVLLTLSFFF